MSETATKPIIFSGPMAQAIQEKRKTQTRRFMRVRGHRRISAFGKSDTAGYDWHFRDAQMRWHDLRHAELLARLPCQAGDLLFVREAWRTAPEADALAPRQLIPHELPIRYEADSQASCGASNWGKLRPSIHMPKWMSRATLKVTDVRVERLHDIAEDDVEAEGIIQVSDDNGQTWKWGLPDQEGLPGTDDHGEPWCEWSTCPIEAFARIWSRINGPDAWDRNDWVWCITFTPHLTNVDSLLAERTAASPSQKG